MATRLRQQGRTLSVPQSLPTRTSSARASLQGASAQAAGFSLISNAKFKQLYSKMLECRLLQDRIDSATDKTLRQRASRFNEALLVGTTLDLGREDWLLPSESTRLAALVKGLPAPNFLKQLKQESASGKEAFRRRMLRVDDDPERSVAPGATSAAAQIAVATGLALSLKAAGRGRIAVAFLDRLSLLHRPSREALLFASAECLPLILVAQRVIRSEKTLARANEPTASISPGGFCAMPIIPVDATDGVAIYRVVHESTHKARHAGGPTLVEAVRLPAGGRSGSRTGSRLQDPISRLEAYLRAKGLFSESWQQMVSDRLRRELDFSE